MRYATRVISIKIFHISLSCKPLQITALLVSSWFIFGQVVKAQPTTIYVPDDYLTIQAGINATNPGDEVYVRAGVYYENIVVNKTISLMGEDGKNTIIDGGGTGNVIYLTANNTSINNFKINGSGADYLGPFTGGDAGIKLDGVANCTISGCIVTGNSLGIFLDESDNTVLRENRCYYNSKDGIYLRLSDFNTIESNECYMNGGHGGIYLNPTCNYNLIENNSCHSNDDIGIKLQNLSDNNVVRNNICNNNQHVGIYLRSSEHNTIANNTCNFNIQVGIYIQLSSNNTVENNICKFTPDDWGIVLRDTSNNNSIINNTSSDNGGGLDIKSSDGNIIMNNKFHSNGAGITFENSTNNEVFYNSIMMNGEGVSYGTFTIEGVKVGDLTGNKLNKNNICNNTEFGIRSEAPIEVDATLNWWGNKSGPGGAGSGSGDPISNNVAYIPWLDAPYPEGKPITSSLSQPYPNPFKLTTTIEFFVIKAELVTVKVYNILGKEITTLLNDDVPFGHHTIEWNGSKQPSGVYFVRLMSSGIVQTKKVLLLK